ncbi:hypothetical protein DFH06DRAFT_1078961 [Mycena polygramma]|nr:hypothetical protein DFH06DRAFT_1078961 [Mycena polygramma]
MSQPPPTIQDAPAPFNGEAGRTAPDFIIRSVDGFDLHVHQAILCHISDFFYNLLGNSVFVPDLLRDGKPVVAVTETCAVLYRLLFLAYPGRPESLDHYSLTAQNLDGVWEVHAAADKYIFTGVQDMLEKMLEDPVLLNAHPHRVFAIARVRRIDALARKAALATLNAPVCPADLAFPELELLPASAFQQLHEFHHSCGKAAEAMVKAHLGPQDCMDPDAVITGGGQNTYVWWNTHSGVHSPDCEPDIEHHSEVDMEITPCQWFQNHIILLAPKLRALPTREVAEKEGASLRFPERALIKNCHGCLDDAERHLSRFKYKLGLQIEESNTALAAAL